MTTALFGGGEFAEQVIRTPTSAGASLIAAELFKKASAYLNDVARSAGGEARLAGPLSELARGYAESKALSVAGEYTIPSASVLLEAKALIESLPEWAPLPSALVEPSGAIAFEWDFGPGRFFVLAVGGTGRLDYSAIFGLGDERYGTVSFAGSLPVLARKLLAEMVETH